MAKRSRQDFSVEYGIFKEVHNGRMFKCDLILVKRGFYNISNAREKASKMMQSNHVIYVVRPV